MICQNCLETIVDGMACACGGHKPVLNNRPMSDQKAAIPNRNTGALFSDFQQMSTPMNVGAEIWFAYRDAVRASIDSDRAKIATLKAEIERLRGLILEEAECLALGRDKELVDWERVEAVEWRLRSAARGES